MSFRTRLAAGPARGLGCANAIVDEVLRTHLLLDELIDALGDTRSVVTIRAANALDKIQRKLPDEVARYGRRILRIAIATTDLRTRWNLIEVVGRLPLKGRDRALAIDLLFEAWQSSSGFLRGFALSGLMHQTRNDSALGKRIRPMLENALDDPSAAVRARARKLLRSTQST